MCCINDTRARNYCRNNLNDVMVIRSVEFHMELKRHCHNLVILL